MEDNLKVQVVPAYKLSEGDIILGTDATEHVVVDSFWRGDYLYVKCEGDKMYRFDDDDPVVIKMV